MQIMLEKAYPLIGGFLGVILAFISKFNLLEIESYKEIMSSSISLGSIAVGFLAAAITLLPSLSNNELVKNLKRLGAYQKLLLYIIKAIIGLFIISILSIVGLFITNISIGIVRDLFGYTWIFIFIVAILSIIRVIHLFLKFLVLTQNNID
ncbi:MULTISPECIES: hypothetical protein [Bacillus]|uniref:hypothetical protein n=1 Tax=Bacillus TaxID=1386 RepID=UPI0004688128|nr:MULTISPECIES: hypothetical protein [Bacillus]MBS4748187.1 hypothetical protein [Bacillus altitudinis]MDI4571007.1 hypothetical protein [Bacillus altitudinis]QRY38455.1 hypothetical protein JVX94_05680 [Bacillus sp. PDNC022]WMT30421.1 hypothetical protein RE735_07790 [Bacillus aerius]